MYDSCFSEEQPTHWFVAMNRSKQRLCQLFVADRDEFLAVICRFVMKKTALEAVFLEGVAVQSGV
jgi:hypothetical protein